MDPTKELSRLVSDRKYEEAFTTALQRSDVSIVSWLCSQVFSKYALDVSGSKQASGFFFNCSSVSLYSLCIITSISVCILSISLCRWWHISDCKMNLAGMLESYMLTHVWLPLNALVRLICTGFCPWFLSL